VIREVFTKFKPEELAITWTGGKDSTLTLWIIRQVCEEDNRPLPTVFTISEHDVFTEIEDFMKEYAAKIYRRAFKLKLLRGRSIKAMVVASLYYSCRSERIPRTLQEILKFTDSDPRDVRRCYRTLVRELKLRI